MSANWPLMSVNVFFVGYGAPCPLMVLRHSVAAGFVVNGVLRTLGVSLRMQNQLREAQA